MRSCRLRRKGKKIAWFECLIDGRTKSFPGVHGTLKKKYTRGLSYIAEGPNKSKKYGSRERQGKQVHRAVFDYIRTGKYPSKKLLMARALIEYLEIDLDQEFQASEVPVLIPKLNCMTQVDLITRDRKTKALHMWEVKCGRGASKKNMGKILPKVPVSAFNMWELQRHYSCCGLIVGNVAVELKNSHVINIFKEKAKKKRGDFTVNVRKIPSWTRKL